MFSHLISREVLLPLGVSLIFAGIILRGFARSIRRAQALRRQNWLDERKPGEAEPPGLAGSWFEKNLPFIANTAAIAGLVVTFASLFRK